MRKFISTAVLTLLALWSPAVLALSSADRAELPHVNLLKNPGFELGKASWSNSGGSFSHSVSGTNGLVTFNPSASGQYFQSELVTVPSNLVGSIQCLASIKHDNTSGNELLKVLDGSSNLIAQVTMNGDYGTEYGGTAIAFKCPSQMRLRVESTADSALATYDVTWLGSDNAAFQYKSASSIGSVKTVGASNCDWTTGNTGGNFTNFSADTDCPAPTATGQLAAPGTKIPAAVGNNLSPGRYMVVVSGNFAPENNTTTATQRCRISDGTSTSGYAANQITSGVSLSISKNIIVGSFDYSNFQSSVTWQPQCQSTSDANDPYIYNSTAQDFTYEVSVYFWPSGEQTGRRYNTYGWMVDANISGSNFSLGTVSDVTSYTELTNASGVLTQNANSTLSVGIPCSSTNAGTIGSTTCSAGSESLGVTFEVPSAPVDVKACVSFSHIMDNGASGNVGATFQIVETGNATQTILQEGKSRVFSSNNNASTAVGLPHRLCGTFRFTSAGQKTLRLFYEQDITATVNNNLIAADSLSNLGQRDIHWEVWPDNQGVPAPVLTGPFENVTNVTGAYTALAGDSIIRAATAGGAFTITLPAAAGLTGKVYTITKTDSSSNLLTVDGNASETIGTVANTKLHAQGETIRIVSNGASWDWISSPFREEHVKLAAPSVGTCAISTQSGSWIPSAPTSAGTGQCSATIPSGIFSAGLTCTCSGTTAGQVYCRALVGSQTSVGFTTGANNTDSNSVVDAICRGLR